MVGWAHANRPFGPTPTLKHELISLTGIEPEITERKWCRIWMSTRESFCLLVFFSSSCIVLPSWSCSLCLSPVPQSYFQPNQKWFSQCWNQNDDSGNLHNRNGFCRCYRGIVREELHSFDLRSITSPTLSDICVLYAALCFTFLSACLLAPPSKHALTTSIVAPSLMVNEFQLLPFSLASCVRRSASSFQSLKKCWNKSKWSAIGRMSVLSRKVCVFGTSANFWLLVFHLAFIHLTTRLESPII